MPDMAGRPMTARLRVRGWLRLAGVVHIGGADHDPNIPMQVALDGRGRLYAPASSLAGPLRRLDPEAGTPVSRWGHDDPATRQTVVSRVVVSDALVTTTTCTRTDGEPADLASPTVVQARSGVGIDRYLGTAAPGILYERAVLPAGLYLRLSLDLESSADDLDTDKAWLSGLLAAMTDGVQVGAAKTRGLGRVTLDPDTVTVVEHRLDSPGGLLQLLHGQAPQWTLTDLHRTHPPHMPHSTRVTVTIDWSPAGPVMVRGPVDGVTVQTVPLVDGDGTDVRLLLPGSSVKGVLRGHAERILRTVTPHGADMGLPEGDGAQRGRAFRQQHTGLPLVNAVFGAPPTAGPRRHAGDTTGIGAVRVDDCLSRTRIPGTLWDELFTPTEPAPDGPGQPAVPADRAPRMPDHLRRGLADLGLQRTDHVAIDRWTGGAAPGRLFSVLEPYGVAWHPITLTLDLERLRAHPQTPAPAGLALLLLVLRDVKAGRVRFGYATHRGLGDITVNAVRLTGGEWPTGIELDDLLASPPAARLTRDWCAYLDTQGQP